MSFGISPSVTVQSSTVASNRIGWNGPLSRTSFGTGAPMVSVSPQWGQSGIGVYHRGEQRLALGRVRRRGSRRASPSEGRDALEDAARGQGGFLEHQREIEHLTVRR